MLELPPDVKVGYRSYRFIPMSPESDPNDEYLGFHHGTKNLIEVDVDHNPPWPKHELVNTVIHEILHAICAVYHCSMEGDDDEEYIVSFMGDGLTQVFHDNPHLIEWILEHCQRDTDEKTSKVL